MASANASRLVLYLISIAKQSSRTTTFETAIFVDAQGARAARVVTAFVNVAAADIRVARVTRFAHAFGRIGWRALAVDSASVPFARTLAPVAVLGVGVVRWRADAFAWLDAAFVGTAFAVRDATDLTGSADTFVRISGEVSGTGAVETARPVETFGSEAARWLSVESFLAFVDIFARTVRSCPIAGRTGAVTDSARHGDAFGSGWTSLFASGAISQQTGSSDHLIRWLTSAFQGIANLAALERIAFITVRAGTVVTSR